MACYANYNAPAYNTKFVKKADLPKSYDEFAAHKEWAGKIAIDGTDNEWLAAIFAYYGEERGRALVKNIVAALNPVVTDGHLALARSVGSGEYWLALNNFLPLTLNVKMSGAPTDFWLLNPVALIFGSVGINALAPHPNAAKLAENFVLSQEAETFMTRKGRIPTRPDVATNPPEVGEMLKPMKIMPVMFNGADQRKWQKTYNELFGRRLIPNDRMTQGEILMKLCRYDDDRLGVVRGDLVHDVTEAQTEIRKSAPYAMKGDAVVAALPQWRERIERMADKAPGKPIAQVKLLPPVARPTKLTCAPTNYQAHIEEMAKASAQPGSQIVRSQSSKILEAGMFLKANSALVGPSEGIPIRFPDRRNDHEVELVMVIGKAGSDISQAKALDHVAGYCLGLDMTVRGREDRSFRKSVDGYAVLGPWMVTADEIPDPDAVPISLTVNGEMRQNSNTSQLIYNCRRLIEFASEFYTLYPGDLLYTGTPEGVGPVKPGDVIVCRSAPALGELKINVRAHEARHACRASSASAPERAAQTLGRMPCCRSSARATRR